MSVIFDFYFLCLTVAFWSVVGTLLGGAILFTLLFVEDWWVRKNAK